DFTNYQRSQVALVKSREVLNSILKEKEVASLPLIRERAAPVEWLERSLQVDFSIAPEIMSISLSGDRPEELKVIVDTVRNVYLRDIVGRESTERKRRLSKLEELLDKYTKLQNDRIEQVKKLQESAGSANPKILELKH